ncbi:unnamed protein product, partial [Ostreobium quekettii]
MQRGNAPAFGTPSPVIGPAVAVQAQAPGVIAPLSVPVGMATPLELSQGGQSGSQLQLQSPQAWLRSPQASGGRPCAYSSAARSAQQLQILGQGRGAAGHGGQHAAQWGSQAPVVGTVGGGMGHAADVEFDFPRGGGTEGGRGLQFHAVAAETGVRDGDLGDAGEEFGVGGEPGVSEGPGAFFPVAGPLEGDGGAAGGQRAGAGDSGEAWADGAAKRSKGRLHEEIVAFAQQCFPSREELQLMQLMEQGLGQVEQATLEVFPNSKTILFGSQASSLSLPGSDMDVVILGAGRDICAPAESFTTVEKNAVVQKLGMLLENLKRRGLVAGRGRVLASAKVPIVKVLMRLGSKALSVDISMGVKNGAAAVELIQSYVMGMPTVRPLVVVLKAILKERNLNEVYSGGISSYVLFNMVVSHLVSEGHQSNLSNAPLLSSVARQIDFLQKGLREVEHDLGRLLVRFLKRFGNFFQYDTMAVSIRGGSAIVPKARLNYNGVSSSILAVEDPQ